jgi:segregation and condensation protein A
VDNFTVKVPDFEGPLDLLLFFIRRDELDIYDIPISHITTEFLEYMHMMEMLDLEIAGEFIVMAATLMQIKARMMLPQPPKDDEGEEGIDPRAELTRRLLEYKRYKEAAVDLQSMEMDQRMRHFRTLFKYDVRQRTEDQGQSLRDVTLYQLIRAFQHAMQNMPKPVVHEVRRIPYNIDDQAVMIMNFFQRRPSYRFLELLPHMKEKIQVIVTFVAMLELIRAQRVRIELGEDFNDFTIHNQFEEWETSSEPLIGLPTA